MEDNQNNTGQIVVTVVAVLATIYALYILTTI